MHIFIQCQYRTWKLVPVHAQFVRACMHAKFMHAYMQNSCMHAKVPNCMHACMWHACCMHAHMHAACLTACMPRACTSAKLHACGMHTCMHICMQHACTACRQHACQFRKGKWVLESFYTFILKIKDIRKFLLILFRHSWFQHLVNKQSYQH